jgi:2',3'-cyclic-nucleotide 2'-phosphodiesterase (5'-nucleotidase family)
MMKKNIRYIIVFASLCSFWLISCTPKVPDEAEIVIISFNDLHGDFENLPQLSGLVNEARTTYKNVIVVDAGDRFTGNPYNDFYEKSQFPIIDMLNHIGLDVAAIGNHEFDFGIDLLDERIKDAEFTLVTANFELKNDEPLNKVYSNLIGIKPYHLIRKNGIKIAFLGLTNVDRHSGIPTVLHERVKILQFFDPIETAMNYRFLRKKSHLFVALTHIGIREDITLADSMPELDLIIGGHSHTLLNEPVIQNGVWITQAYRSANYAGKTKITFKKGVVTEISNELINLQTWTGPVDSVIIKKIQYYKNNPFLDEPFTTIQHEFSSIEQIGCMMTDAALTVPMVDFSLMNCAGIRINRLPAGPITYADIFRISPFGNTLVIVELTPAEIRNLIEMEFTDKRDYLAIPAGFEYTAKRIPGDNIRVEKLMYPNGKKLDENKTYRLILNNYLVSTYLADHADRALNTDITVVDNMVEFLKNNPNTDYRNVRTRAKFN